MEAGGSANLFVHTGESICREVIYCAVMINLFLASKKTEILM